MDSLCLVCAQRAIDDEAGHGVFVIDVVIVRRLAGDVYRGGARAFLVYLVVFTVIGVGGHAFEECIPGLPVMGEVDA